MTLLVILHHCLVPILQVRLHIVDGAIPPHKRLCQQLVLLVRCAGRQVALINNPLHIHTPPQTVGKLFKR